MSTESRTPVPGSAVRALVGDARLAVDLVRGSDRREWWRLGLTAFGAFLATCFALAAGTVAAIPDGHPVRYTNGLLNGSGVRPGLVLALLLLLIPVLGFLGQATRIGAVHRDRRFAALRLTGATTQQVRTVAAFEAGVTCLVGSVAGLVGFLGVRAVLDAAQSGRSVLVWPTDIPVFWPGFVLVTLAMPLLATAAGVLALRRVASSPLGVFRRTRPPRSLKVYVLVAVLLVAGAGVAYVGSQEDLLMAAAFPAIVAGAVVLIGAGAVSAAGAASRFLGNRLVGRAQSPALLIAAGRLQSDPWAAARVHATVILITVVGVGFTGIRRIVLDALKGPNYAGNDTGFYESGFAAVGLTVLVALSIAMLGLAVGTAESLLTRRRALAAQYAAGVPRSVLRRALLVETALPLAPAVLLAGLGGLVIYAAYMPNGSSFPLLQPLLVPVAVYAACLLAAAASLPLLGRTLRPAELRHE
ncbi:FtsX-like permease family protein [Streptomyces sp. YIM 130001]|uniref:FtsX-like permease family protein n=1 Tax=Streptomyces sp. YIM 130001 TaxID=2259644 RepID=UPI000E65921A|nr:FtsX-like permease family protein [Streptomyces sp. YIM 130001]RII19506.1 FtsX-like permease family protein [Streptomyces sp. YIM 130001]